MSVVKRNEERAETEIDLLEVVQLLLANLKWIILSTLVLAGIVFVATYFLVTPLYRASATFYVNNSTAGTSDTNSVTNADLTASARLVNTYSAIIKSNAIMDRVVSELGEDVSSAYIKNHLTTKAVNDTEVFTVSVVHSNPKTAVKIVNLITEIAPAQISEIVEGSSTKIIDYPKMPTGVDSPNYIRNAAMGGIIGFIIACAYFIVRSLMDNTIKSAADLEYWDIPVLGVIPDFASADKSAGYAYGKKK